MVQKLYRLPAVRELTGMGRSKIYREMAAGRFPRPVRVLGERVVVWPESVIAEWQRKLLAAHSEAP